MEKEIWVTINQKIHDTAVVSNRATIKGNGQLLIGKFATIEDDVTIDTSASKDGKIVIGSRAKIKTGTILKSYGGRMEIGHHTSIGEFNLLASHGGLIIGKECIFGPFVFINAASHIVSGTDEFRYQGELAAGVKIGDGVWLGARCSVLDGVTIGARCIVGAHSLVLQSLEAEHVAFGLPATIKRKSNSS